MKFNTPDGLKKYVFAEKIDLSAAALEARTYEERVIFILTQPAPAPLLNTELYEASSKLCHEIKPFIIEALTPLPIFSAKKAEVSLELLRTILSRIFKSNLRITGAVGFVEFGNFGSPAFMSLGSSGKIMPALLQAATAFNPKYSWMNLEMASTLGFKGSLVRDVDGYEFYGISLPS